MGLIKAAGIIAEYNPFHNGHAYHIQATRAAGATHIVAVMSPHFVQRGEAACAPKEVRAQAAVEGGADLVLELPLPWAMSTAERFAAGAVCLLHNLGCLDMLSFGCESQDSDTLALTARTLDNPACHALIRETLSQGVTYAAARQQAVLHLGGKEAAEPLSRPNDILAVEYLRQLALQGCKLKPLPIQRFGAAHDAPLKASCFHSLPYLDEKKTGASLSSQVFASAGALRKRLYDRGICSLRPYMPPGVYASYSAAAKQRLLPWNHFRMEPAVICALRSLDKSALSNLPDLSEGLENRLYNSIRQACALEELYALMKTKRYPLSRIRRLVWSAFLGIPKDLHKLSPPYLRILAVGPGGRELLAAAGKNARLPLSPSLAKLARENTLCARVAALEAKASDIYALGTPLPGVCGQDYRHRLHRV